MSHLFDDKNRDGKVVEDFDSRWYRTLITEHGADEIFLSRDDDEKHGEWIELPDRHDQVHTDGYVYHKKFRFQSEIQQPSQFFLLVSLDETEEVYREISGISVWLNGTKIFEGDLSLLNMDVTGYLSTNEENTFVIYSHEGHPFSLKVLLIVCPMQSVLMNDTQLESTCTASLSHCDGLIDLMIDASIRIDDEDDDHFAPLDETWDQVMDDDIEKSKEVEQIRNVPRLAILILIVGTRGDVQPFIALGKMLVAYGHRVRLATHTVFETFVRGNGLEFYPLAGDPADLISFMVKNAGIFPSFQSICKGDISKNRQTIYEILESTWKACIEPDQKTNVPFIAEAIIANPPSYGHIHCAEKLGIPLHMMFTMPWSPTKFFPHPLCRFVDENSSKKYRKYSYRMIETLIWSGLKDFINEFREKTLGLPCLRTAVATEMFVEEFVPFTYCWSPSLIPRPTDWPHYIHTSGFFFLDLATNYEPPEDLLKFLDIEPKPIYIGFGSIAGHDAHRLAKLIVDALKETGYRAIISNLPIDPSETTENIYKIGDCPHDWLFKKVSAVCHHGGAGTTAAGLRAGKATIVVPFFGDQFFWGSTIHKSGAGPAPISGKDLTKEDFIKALNFVHEPSAQQAAEKLSSAFSHEDGCQEAVRHFHTMLPLKKMISDLEPSFPACFYLEKEKLQISRPVANALIAAGRIKRSDLSLHETRSWTFSREDRFLPLKNFLDFEQKAFRSFFSRTKRRGVDLKSAIFQGLGQMSIGCLAFYGDLTDALENFPRLYDLYNNEEDKKERKVTNLVSGAQEAGRVVWSGFSSAVTDMFTKPKAGFEREGVAGLAKGTISAVPNIIIKPLGGTLASVTWLSRGVYAQAMSLTGNSSGQKSVPVLLGNSRVQERTRQDSNDYEDSDEFRASILSGMNEDVCRDILTKFDEIRAKQKHSS